MSDTERLAEIEARENAATRAPWMVVYDGLCHEIVRRENGMRIAWVPYDFGPIDDANNAAFIAAARDDIPWLLARLRELEAGVARDAKVVEAARAYRAAERKVEAAGYASMSIGDRLIRGDLRERLDAALADAEG